MAQPEQTPIEGIPSNSVFDERSDAHHAALEQLRTLMRQVGFLVAKKRDNEATLRAYVGERHTYPLLNPRFIWRKVRGFKGDAFLEITVLSKGNEPLERRLSQFHPLAFLRFEAVGEWQSPYFVHGHFFTPLTFHGPPASAALDIGGLEQALQELRKYLGAEISNHVIDFDTQTNHAFTSLGALPPGQHWSQFDVPLREAAEGNGTVLVTTIWNFHWSRSGSKRTATRPAIARDGRDDSLWYRMPRPGADASSNNSAHWNRITLARELGVPIVGVLKDFSTSRCSLLDTFQCPEVRDDLDGEAVWLRLTPRRPLASDMETVDIHERTGIPLAQDGQIGEAILAIDAVIRPAAVAGQSWLADGARRRSIELYAMEQAINHYKAQWPVVEDVSAKESFDLRCRNGHVELRVEVKGTTTAGGSILLTRNEVRHAEDSRNSMSLFVVSGILVDSANNCSGGIPLVIEPWIINRERLAPIAYEYEL